MICREEQRANEKKERDERIRAEQNARQKKKNDFNSAYGHLGVTNDAEIDAKIAELEFAQAHESNNIREDKALVNKIKLLQVDSQIFSKCSYLRTLDKTWKYEVNLGAHIHLISHSQQDFVIHHASVYQVNSL